MKIHFLFLGSAGDFFPLLRIAMEMRAAGHQVAIAGNPWASYFAALANMSFTPVKDEVPDFDPFNDEMVANVALKDIPLVYTYVKDNYVPGESLFVSCVGYLGAKLAAEELGFDIITILYSDYSLNEPMGLDKPKTEKHFASELNNYRSKINLPSLNKPCLDWIIDSPCKLALYPQWFEHDSLNASLSNSDIFYAGFPLPAASSEKLPDPIESFLSKDSKKTILFTPGTPHANTHAFIDPVLAAAKALDVKCILVFRHKEGDNISLPVSEDILHVELVAFENLFHRLDLIIHHGGVGTLSEALRAGKPQIIKPTSWDQFSNGEKIESMGVGRVITKETFTSEHITQVIHELLESTSVAQACRDYKQRVELDEGIPAAADFIRRTGVAESEYSIEDNSERSLS